MRREVSGSKGFFLTVIVLLALAVFVSYWGDSTAGQAIRSQGPGNQEPICTTTWSDVCAFTVDSTTSSFATESGAKAASLKECEEDRANALRQMSNCINTKRNQCRVPCIFIETDRKDTTGSKCTVISCTNNIKNRDGSTTGCIYEYDLNSRRIEPGRCNSHDSYMQAYGWSCTARDGSVSSTVTCKP